MDKFFVDISPDNYQHVVILADIQDMIPLGGTSYYFPNLNTDFGDAVYFNWSFNNQDIERLDDGAIQINNGNSLVTVYDAEHLYFRNEDGSYLEVLTSSDIFQPSEPVTTIGPVEPVDPVDTSNPDMSDPVELSISVEPREDLVEDGVLFAFSVSAITQKPPTGMESVSLVLQLSSQYFSLAVPVSLQLVDLGVALGFQAEVVVPASAFPNDIAPENMTGMTLSLNQAHNPVAIQMTDGTEIFPAIRNDVEKELGEYILYWGNDLKMKSVTWQRKILPLCLAAMVQTSFTVGWG